MTRPKIIIQFNEANFDLISKYIKKYNLQNLKKIQNFDTKINTTSESKYENLEPWIQWYSFYTQKPFEDHQVFHLGDAIKNKYPTFLEKYEKLGIFGSMNIPSLNNASVFIPDAWSELKADNSISSKVVHSAMSQLVNDNSKLKVSLRSLMGLILLVGIPFRIKVIKMIIKSFKSIIIKSRSELAAIFDYFFLNYSLKRILKKKLDLSLIFLNGLAHTQHHHLLDSEFIKAKNPRWYSKDIDHLSLSLKIYDDMFENLFSRVGEKYDIWVITGLSQFPCESPIYYWRFDNHKMLLKNFLDFEFKVYPRMTRDFEIEYFNSNCKIKLLEFLNNSKVHDKNGVHDAFGKIDDSFKNRIFCSFIYNGDSTDSSLKWNNVDIPLKDKINFIAIKNGEHNSKGWAFSNSKKKFEDTITIWNLSNLI